jgi:hypothetical protein
MLLLLLLLLLGCRSFKHSSTFRSAVQPTLSRGTVCARKQRLNMSNAPPQQLLTV